MGINIKGPKEKLGDDKYQEILDKDWKVVELPTEEELANEKPGSPKARNNPNSRKNLVQYNKRSKDVKKKNINNLQFVEKEEDFDPSSVFEDQSIISIIDTILPAKEIMSSRKEQEMYYNYIKFILKDFDPNDLTSSDIDDITILARNKVMETRLLKASAKNPKLVLEAMPSIDKLSKATEKIKSGLASRRVDRIDVKNRPAFSIVDMAAHLDEQEKLDFEQRTLEMEKKRKDFKPPTRDKKGHLIDSDA